MLKGTKCKDGKMTKEREGCRTEVFSRVCGFFRPIQSWNKGKVEEHHDKKTYNIGKDKPEDKTVR